MSSLVLELQRDTLDRNVRVSDLLRKALVVAKKLGLEDSVAWISKELNGYLPDDECPSYRTLAGEVKAWNPYHGWVPVYFEDLKQANRLSKLVCRQSIAELESLLEGKSKNGIFGMPYSKDVELDLLKGIGPLTRPNLQVQHSSIFRVIDAARTIVLEWALKLERDGVLGEGLSFSPEEKKIASGPAYNITNFFGPVEQSQIQQQTTQSTQTAIKSVLDLQKVKDFVESVKTSFNELDLDAENNRELKAEVATIESQLSSPKPKTSIIKESLQSAKRILESASGAVAGQLLLKLGELLLGG